MALPLPDGGQRRPGKRPPDVAVTLLVLGLAGAVLFGLATRKLAQN